MISSPAIASPYSLATPTQENLPVAHNPIMRAASLKTKLGIVLLVSVVALPVQGQSRLESESKVLALEQLWGEAAQMRDTRALAAIFDDGLVYVHIDGRPMTKPEVLADTRKRAPVEVVGG